MNTTTRRAVEPFYNLYLIIFGSRMAAMELKQLAKKCSNNVEQLVDLIYNFELKFLKFQLLSLRPLQLKTEITALGKIVQELNPKVIVEIGTARGGTLFLFANVANPDKIISVDLPGGSFGGSYSFGKIPLYQSLGKKRVIQLIRANSHNEETRAKTQSRLNGDKIDVLFIDGDHTYQGVKQDFLMYSPLVRKGGIVALHDIVTHDPTVGCTVDEFWNEIKQNYRHVEIIENQNQKWAGIGILYV